MCFVEWWSKVVEYIALDYKGFELHIVIPPNLLAIIFVTRISNRTEVEFI